MDKNGDLIKGFTDASVVRGDTKGFGGSETSSPMDSGAPVSTLGAATSRDATNSMGSVGDTGSDPMDMKFSKDARTGGSESPESVGHESFSGDSDPMFQDKPKGEDFVAAAGE